MASTFLVRLRVGPILVDAKGLGKVYQGRVRRADLVIFVLSAVATMAIVISVTDPAQLDLKIYWEEFKNLLFSLREAIFG